MSVDTLYSDNHLIAVSKPSGLLVHRGWGRDPTVLVDLVKEMAGQSVIHPLHRIDRQTSGVVLFAREAETAAILQARFEAGEVEKIYLALVRGTPPEDGLVDHPIPRREDGPRVPAMTSFRKLATLQTEPRVLSLVEARPRTGRLHQVRRHLKHISHPVIGDANYGKGPLNRAIRERYGLARMALHAAALAFPHPATGAIVTIRAPLPEDLRLPFERMGLFLDEWGQLM